MPNYFVDTFINLIPLHIMKFITWQDVEGFEDEEVQAEDVPYSDEDEDVEEVVDVQDSVELNQVLQV